MTEKAAGCIFEFYLNLKLQSIKNLLIIIRSKGVISSILHATNETLIQAILVIMFPKKPIKGLQNMTVNILNLKPMRRVHFYFVFFSRIKSKQRIYKIINKM